MVAAKPDASAPPAAADPPPRPAPEHHFWDQLPDESDAAYLAYCRYRDMGALERSMDKAYRAQYPLNDPRRAHRHPEHWTIWARRFQWQARNAAYDSHVDLLTRHARESALVQSEVVNWTTRRKDLSEREYQVGLALLEKGKEMLQFPLATTQQEVQTEQADGKTVVHQTIVIHPGKWTMRDAAALLEVGTRLLQESTGGQTEAAAGGGAGDAVAQEARPMLTMMHEAIERADEETRDEILQVYEHMMAQARRLQELITGVGAPSLAATVAAQHLRDFVPDDDETDAADGPDAEDADADDLDA